jgi:23S rRNA (uridine2552-2'-O)-methyltransferase
LEVLLAVSPAFEVVVSDLAPRTTGVRLVDQQRSLELAQRAWEIAQAVLTPGGHFLVKIFEGPEVNSLVAALRGAFTAVHRVKPPGSRQESRELYLVGLKRRDGHRQAKGARPPEPPAA